MEYANSRIDFHTGRHHESKSKTAIRLAIYGWTIYIHYAIF